MHRETFSLGEGIYLLNHSVGRPPRSAESAAKAGFFEPWQTGAAEPWEAWFTEVDRFRSAVSGMQRSRKPALPAIASTKPIDGKSASV